jgi:hypothetical protein
MGGRLAGKFIIGDDKISEILLQRNPKSRTKSDLRRNFAKFPLVAKELLDKLKFRLHMKHSG